MTFYFYSYIVSVNDNDVTPGFPYISDTGGKPPESCIFALVCSISGIIGNHYNVHDGKDQPISSSLFILPLLLLLLLLLGFVIVYIRFQHIHQYYKSKVQWLNIISVVVGALSVFGILIVGAFQVCESSIVHLFIYPSTHPSIHPLIHSFIHPFIHSFTIIHSSIYA